MKLFSVYVICKDARYFFTNAWAVYREDNGSLMVTTYSCNADIQTFDTHAPHAVFAPGAWETYIVNYANDDRANITEITPRKYLDKDNMLADPKFEDI